MRRARLSISLSRKLTAVKTQRNPVRAQRFVHFSIGHYDRRSGMPGEPVDVLIAGRADTPPVSPVAADCEKKNQSRFCASLTAVVSSTLKFNACT